MAVLVFAFVGLLVLGFFLRGEEQTVNGVVVELVREKQPRRDAVYYPVLEFTDAQGIAHRVKSSFGKGDRFVSVGDTVEVSYLVDHPEVARTTNLFTLFDYLLIVVFAFFFSLFGLAIFIGNRLLRRNSQAAQA